MSGERARANHALYLARIVLTSWQRALADQDIPATTLSAAFYSPVRDHLLRAYGSFLLAVTHAEQGAAGLPRSCDELAPMPEGKVFPGEINEFRQLEARGWLGEMLREVEPPPPRARQAGNLVVDSDSAGAQQVEQWLEQMAALFARMDDSLDEY